MEFTVFRDQENVNHGLRNKENNVLRDQQPKQRRSVLGVLNSKQQPFNKQAPPKSKVQYLHLNRVSTTVFLLWNVKVLIMRLSDNYRRSIWFEIIIRTLSYTFELFFFFSIHVGIGNISKYYNVVAYLCLKLNIFHNKI